MIFYWELNIHFDLFNLQMTCSEAECDILKYISSKLTWRLISNVLIFIIFSNKHNTSCLIIKNTNKQYSLQANHIFADIKCLIYKYLEIEICVEITMGLIQETQAEQIHENVCIFKIVVGTKEICKTTFMGQFISDFIADLKYLV